MVKNYYCAVCGDVVLEIRELEYEYPVGSGNYKTDLLGDLTEGTAQCGECKKYFCVYCNETVEGLCPDCLEKGVEHGDSAKS
jgi:hypothetical protein